MSPSESDLRAALHDGEGDVPKVDLLILRADARAAQRRTRLLSAAVIVGIVASAGVGIGFLASNSGQDEKHSANAFAAGGSAALRAPVASAEAGAGGGNAGGAYAADAAACPGNSARSAAHEGPARLSMFSASVTTVVMCAYSHSSARVPQPTSLAIAPRVVLSGTQATELVQSLKKASTKRPSGMCPLVRTQSRPLFMIALTSDGTVAGVATTDLGVPACNVVSVSAEATRYSWSPPADLAPKLAKLEPVPVATPTH